MNRKLDVLVLMVEDDPGDADLTIETLSEINDDGEESVRIKWVEDGAEALEYLQQRGAYIDAATPDLILLDLNLPRRNGREVLREVKADERLRHIPIVVLTTSNAEDDIQTCYKLGASCYVTKPIGMDEYARVMESIHRFWFSTVEYAHRRN